MGVCGGGDEDRMAARRVRPAQAACDNRGRRYGWQGMQGPNWRYIGSLMASMRAADEYTDENREIAGERDVEKES